MPLLIAVLSATILAHGAPGTAQVHQEVRPEHAGRETARVDLLPLLPADVGADALPAVLPTARPAVGPRR